MTFLELPWQWWLLVAGVPTVLLVARVATWLILRRRDPRPGYLDHRVNYNERSTRNG